MIELKIIIKFAKKKLRHSKNKKPFSIAFNDVKYPDLRFSRKWNEVECSAEKSRAVRLSSAGKVRRAHEEL